MPLDGSIVVHSNEDGEELAYIEGGRLFCQESAIIDVGQLAKDAS